MKMKSSKKLETLMREVRVRTEPRAAAALFGTGRKLPAVRLKKILAPVDFSKFSLGGVRYAALLTNRVGASLSLVHVVSPALRCGGQQGIVLAQSDLEVLESVERQVSRLADKLSKKDSPVRPFIRYGKPFNEICVLARARGTDLIVMATHGRSGLKRILLGSTTERVVRHAPCSVLTIPSRAIGSSGGKSRPFRLKKIIVPIDFSEISTRALPYAAVLAERFDAEIILLHIIEPLPLPADSAYLPADYQSEDQNTAKNNLNGLSSNAFRSNLSVRTLVRNGQPFDEITRTAASLGADMVILTTHGYTGLMHVLLGSTAERVVRYADCPVLVVR